MAKVRQTFVPAEHSAKIFQGFRLTVYFNFVRVGTEAFHTFRLKNTNCGSSMNVIARLGASPSGVSAIDWHWFDILMKTPFVRTLGR